MHLRTLVIHSSLIICMQLLALGAFLGCSKSRQQTDPSSESTAITKAELAQSAGPRLYVSNEDSGDVSVIDVARDAVIARIEVGKRPRGVRVSNDEKLLFVALSGSPKAPPGIDETTLPEPDRSADGIGVVDLATGRLVRTLESGTDPESFDISPDGKLLYVSNEDAGRASILDLASGKIVGVVSVGGEPEGVTTRPDGKAVYVTSEQENRVDVVDPSARRVIAKIPTGLRPRAVVFTPDGTRAFVSAEFGAEVLLVDSREHRALRKMPIPGEGVRPMGLALSPDSRQLFVSTGRGRTVVQLDVETGAVVRTVPDVGARPWGLAITSDGKKLYTANGPSNDVSVIDVASGKVETRIAVGKSPWGVALATGDTEDATTRPEPRERNQ